MPDMSRLWGRTATEPVFVLTADQAWSPEWAIAAFLEQAGKWGQPFHFFRTSPSPLLDEAVKMRNGAVTQGWHPNFMPASSQGATVDEVVQYCQRLFPGARTAQAHCYADDSFRTRALAKAGIVADLQNPTPCQGYLLPMVHPSGIVRLPVYFQDDIAFDAVGEFTVDVFLQSLLTPGLKILNFHPTFVGCNTPSLAHYNSVRGRVFGTSRRGEGVVWQGRGTANMLDELMGEILIAGYRFEALHAVVDELLISVEHAPQLLPRGSLLHLDR